MTDVKCCTKENKSEFVKRIGQRHKIKTNY